MSLTVTCLAYLGDWYTGLVAQTLVPKKHFSNFLFSDVISQCIHLFQNDLGDKNADRREKQ